jgi:hypothetical protein
MSVARRHLDQSRLRPVGASALSLALLARRYCLETFCGEPTGIDSGKAAFPAGTDTNRIILNTGTAGNQFEFTYVGGASDGFVPTLATEGGYNWTLDATLAEGVNINFGGTVKGHPRTYRPNSENFFARLLLNCTDASGLNAFFALQDVGSIAAGYTDWTNVAGIRILGDDSSTTALVRAETNIGNTGSTDTVSSLLTPTLEEPTEIELEVQVIGASARFLVNGVQRAVSGLTVAYTGSPTLTPTLALLQSTDTTAKIKTLAFECGLIEDRYEGPTLRTLLTAIGAAAATA